MTITQLRCFLAMAEKLNFTQVARELYISQAAVSYHIRSLEDELEVSLFNRSTRKVTLTDPGRQFYREVSQGMRILDQACEKVRAGKSKNSFIIGYSGLCYGKCFQTILRHFVEEHPGLSVNLNSVEPEDGLLDLVAGGQVDIALFLNPFSELPEEVDFADYGEACHLLMVPDDHPLAERKEIDTNDLPTREIMAHGGIKRMEQMKQSRFGRVVEQRRGSSTPPQNLESLLSMVRSGLCLARLPAIDVIDQSGIRCLRVTGKNASLGVGPNITLAWRRDGATPEIRHFRAFADEILGGEK